MARTTLTDAEVLSQVPAARARAKRSQADAPHAVKVRYDRTARTVQVRLTNGAALTLPIALIGECSGARDADLDAVSVGPAGVALRWDRLDLDVTVASLIQRGFGTRALLGAAGAAGGSVRSPAKARAARLNGRKGGRPAKRGLKA